VRIFNIDILIHRSPGDILRTFASNSAIRLAAVHVNQKSFQPINGIIKSSYGVYYYVLKV
jgi:hypothetical protein